MCVIGLVFPYVSVCLLVYLLCVCVFVHALCIWHNLSAFLQISLVTLPPVELSSPAVRMVELSSTSMTCMPGTCKPSLLFQLLHAVRKRCRNKCLSGRATWLPQYKPVYGFITVTRAAVCAVKFYTYGVFHYQRKGEERTGVIMWHGLTWWYQLVLPHVTFLNLI